MIAYNIPQPETRAEKNFSPIHWWSLSNACLVFINPLSAYEELDNHCMAVHHTHVHMYTCTYKLFLFLLMQILYLMVVLLVTFNLLNCVHSQGMSLILPHFSAKVNEYWTQDKRYWQGKLARWTPYFFDPVATIFSLFVWCATIWGWCLFLRISATQQTKIHMGDTTRHRGYDAIHTARNECMYICSA